MCRNPSLASAVPIADGRRVSDSPDTDSLRSGKGDAEFSPGGRKLESFEDAFASDWWNACDIDLSFTGVARPDVSPKRLVGAATPTEELGELALVRLFLRGKKLEVICRD